MWSATGRILLAMLIGIAVSGTVSAEISDDRVRAALKHGVDFLKSKQRPDGSWPDTEYAHIPTGVHSLCTLALLNAGLTADDPTIKRALTFLRRQTDLKKTYTVSLQTLVFCAAGEKDDLPQLARNISWLEAAQRKGKAGGNAGGWHYDNDGGDGADPSNSQFALLALHEAERFDETLEVMDATWRLADGYWKRLQRSDGSFGYSGENPSTGSMTCAGIGSLIIASGRVAELDARVEGDEVQCCQSAADVEQPIELALKWLGKHFSASRNPASVRMGSGTRYYYYYYMYALERVGRLAGRRFIGEHDWYRAGVEVLLDGQDPLSGYWPHGKSQLVSTAFSVLFLSKGRRPILIANLKRAPERDWNHHRHGLANLTSHVESRWQRDLTWQIVDLSAATAEDLWQSPVLFLSGREALKLTQSEKDALQRYVAELGGFLFVENCCDDGDAFDRDFRVLMAELFPDTQLRLLPPEHPIWFAEQRVAPEFLRPLEGIDACCRTGVVYSPEKLSCYWELASPRRSGNEDLPERIQKEVEACLAIGANVATYATGRELRRKLDRSGLVSVLQVPNDRDRAMLGIAKLQHAGGSDDAPSAVGNMLAVLQQEGQIPVSPQERLVAPNDPNLPDYPIAYVHGRRAFRWSQAERKAIKRFIDNGGVILGDAICANEEFANALRREMQAIFPSAQWVAIPPSHSMFTASYQGFEVSTVTLRDPRQRTRRDQRLSVRNERISPRLEGIEIDGNFVVIFSPYDISCAMENRPSLECRGYVRGDAAKLAVNLILYAMQQ